MAATKWSPAPYISKQEWLLADGSIVTSPEFETSSSGRRVRVVGETTSIGNRQVDTLIQATVDKVATERGTTRLARVFSPADTDAVAASGANAPFSVFEDAVTLHLLSKEQGQRNDRGKTTAVWKYEAEGFAPIQAYVFVSLDQRYNEAYYVMTHIVWRDTRANQAQFNNLYSYDGTNINSMDLYRYGDEYKRLEAFLQKNPLPFSIDVKNYTGQMRNAVVKFAERCQEVDALDELVLPLGDGLTATTFKRTLSNYSASFNAELLDFVQTGPVLERIKDNYAQLLQDFKTLGIVVTDEINGGDIAQAINGNLTKIHAVVRANEDEEESRSSIDTYHTVAFDFATGTVVVDCGRTDDLNEVAEAWEIAKFKAEMTGEEDVLLAYAKAYREPKEQARLKKIIKQRKVDITKGPGS